MHKVASPLPAQWVLQIGSSGLAMTVTVAMFWIGDIDQAFQLAIQETASMDQPRFRRFFGLSDALRESLSARILR